MFQFPKQAEFNRVLPKSKIYAFARPTRSLKDRFVFGIQDIVWKYKLAPETVKLPARHGIQEIQVFDVALKTEDLGDEVLHTIDKAVPSPIIYQLIRRAHPQGAGKSIKPTPGRGADEQPRRAP